MVLLEGFSFMDDCTRILAFEIGRNIKNLRSLQFPGKGSQKRCAAAFGVDVSHFVKWESGKILPSDKNQARLASFFNVSVAELRGDVPLVFCEECKKKNQEIQLLSEQIREQKRMLDILMAFLSQSGKSENVPAHASSSLVGQSHILLS